MPAARTRKTRKVARAPGSASAAAMLLLSRDLELLGYRGNIKALIPPLPEQPGGRLAGGRLASAIRLLIEGMERGHFRKDAALEIPAVNGRPPLRVTMMALPHAGPERRAFAALIEPASQGPAELESRVEQLESQLKSAQDFLRGTIEQYEASNEELRCSYEELRSANEELQSTTDQLHDSHASLAVARDRLEVMNRALQAQNTRLQRQFEEFRGVLNSLGSPVLVLNNDLRIRFFNRQAERLFRLTVADEGASVRSLASAFSLETLADNCAAVLEQLQPVERTIGNFSFQIRPLLTSDSRIEGVVLVVDR